MFGFSPYSTAPYSALSNNILFVVVCVDVYSQKVYECTINAENVYLATISTSLINNANIGTAVNGVTISNSPVYLVDVNVNKGAC